MSLCLNTVSAYWQTLIKVVIFYIIPTLKDMAISKCSLLDTFTFDVGEIDQECHLNLHGVSKNRQHLIFMNIRSYKALFRALYLFSNPKGQSPPIVFSPAKESEYSWI